MLHETVDAIRALTPRDFVLGIKINSADYVQAGEQPSNRHVETEMKRILEYIRLISHWGTIDFIEINFMTSAMATPRQAFFSHFSKAAMEYLKREHPFDSECRLPLILLTGGLRSPAHLQTALDAGHADLLGIGRGSILCPELPNILRKRRSCIEKGISLVFENDTEPYARGPNEGRRPPFWFPRVKLLGASVVLAWYTVRMREIAESHIIRSTGDRRSPSIPLPNYDMGAVEAMLKMWIWVDWSRYWWVTSVVTLLIIFYVLYFIQ
ncbi:hypothetical protein ID866_8865 [Astraeus odoratus]|nr:hypothetical protein ID866_8865 [Astraeus odoratus]